MTTKVRKGSRFRRVHGAGRTNLRNNGPGTFIPVRAAPRLFVPKTSLDSSPAHPRCARTIASATRQRNSHKDKNPP